jgi:hypothetical protein
MASNSAFRITELDPNEIKANLKTYLRGQDEFTDIDFEGSGINILLDILARNTHYMAYYMNMLAAESFIDSAQLRQSIVSHAKHIGYTPESMKGARTFADITITPSDSEDQDATSLTMPKWTTYVSQAIDGINYNFVTTSAHVATKANGSFLFANVELKQGDVVTRTFLVTSDNEKREYIIPSANVDIDEMYVSVQQSTSNTYSEVYTLDRDMTTLRANSQVYFIEETTSANNHYKLFFGDGILGKRPIDGNIITVTYLDSQGKYGNGANSFLLVETVDGYNDNVSIVPAFTASGGSERETVESIRYHAPRSYTTQSRAVTENDYLELFVEDFPNIQSVKVWGGEQENPPLYGKVFVAIKPKNNYFITNLEKQQMIDQFVANRSIQGMIPEIVDPDYTWLLVKVKVYYDADKTNRDENELKTSVRNAILTYRDETLQRFDSKFRITRLARAIEATDPAINSATVTLKIQKRVTPSYSTNKTYTVSFLNPIEKNTLTTYPALQAVDSTGTIRNCYIEEVPLSWTGVDKIVVYAGGTNYEDASVTITGDGTGAVATAQIVNKKIASVDLVERGNNYTKATVTISSNTGYGANAIADLQFNNGTLRLFYYKSNGGKVFVNNEIGTINYSTGEVVFENLKITSLTDVDNYNDDVLTVNVEPQEPDIDPVRKTILDLDENDNIAIQITMVSE